MLTKLSNLLCTSLGLAQTEHQEGHSLQVATAVLLSEVMRADSEIAESEQAALRRILKERFNLSDDEAGRLAQRGRAASLDASDLYQFTSAINQALDLPERVQIMEYLWQVALADSRLDAYENHLMRRLADLLYIGHGDYVAAKTRARNLLGLPPE
ncbi:MAG: TerB family tellurite resistance protein [Rhodocyclaceae bacterium]|nr:TerB family tellurite resistance protein [Rhodocyclaceae bacterium]MBX3671091.1 TerB family tellurite resistance protein [Rhodocyclaceae bacterium]